jgi:predicted nucleic acid-binding protein
MIVEILLDSVILIDHFNNISQATDYLKEIENSAVISVITRAETLVGFDEGPAKMLAIQFLDRFPHPRISTEAQINRYLTTKGNHKGLPLHDIV